MRGPLIKLAGCLPCSAAADLLCITQHGLSPLHNKWDPSAAIPLATHLTTSSMSAHPDSSDTMQVVVCRACLKGPCKRLPDAGNIPAAGPSCTCDGADTSCPHQLACAPHHLCLAAMQKKASITLQHQMSSSTCIITQGCRQCTVLALPAAVTTHATCSRAPAGAGSPAAAAHSTGCGTCLTTQPCCQSSASLASARMHQQQRRTHRAAAYQSALRAPPARTPSCGCALSHWTTGCAGMDSSPSSQAVARRCRPAVQQSWRHPSLLHACASHT